jgi:predicted glutamine amidotransferase
MCGIAGYAKTPYGQTKSQLKTLRKISKSLLSDIAERGRDSTGVAMLTRDGEPIVFKTLTGADRLVSSSEYSKIVNEHRADTTICMMHTRFATEGDVTVANAHPFVVGNTIGTHNGIIYNYKDLHKSNGEMYEVDSKYLFHFVNEREKLQDALDEIYGDYAIAWIKESKTELNLLHEGGRDLALAYWREARVLIYASTKKYLEKALKKYRVDAVVHEAKNDIHYAYDVDKFSTQSSHSEKSKINSNILSSKYALESNNYGRYGTNYGGYQLHDYDYSDYLGASKDSDLVWDVVYCESCNDEVYAVDVVKDGDKYTCVDCEVANNNLDPKIQDYGFECNFCGDYADTVIRDAEYYFCETCMDSPLIREEVNIDHVYDQARL